MKKPDQFDACAYHEAGHATMAWLQGNAIRERGIEVSAGGSAGIGSVHIRRRTVFVYAEAARMRPLFWRAAVRHAFADVAEYQAGWLAEHRRHGLGEAWRAEGDLEDALIFTQEEPGDWGDTATAMECLAILWRARCGLPEGAWIEGDGLRALIRAYRFSERRAAAMLYAPKTWAALSELAELLKGRGRVAAEEAEAIFERRGIPQRFV